MYITIHDTIKLSQPARQERKKSVLFPIQEVVKSELDETQLEVMKRASVY